MLSYMPLAFNLLAPWGHTLERASGYLLEMLPAFTGTARQLLFEHSPGRGNPKFTGDYTAFDALIRYSDCHDRNGFIAFEIKYSEAMREPISELKPRAQPYRRGTHRGLRPRCSGGARRKTSAFGAARRPAGFPAADPIVGGLR